VAAAAAGTKSGQFTMVVSSCLHYWLTDCRYFVPSFVELTTSDVAENRRLLAENGITYPIGMYSCCWSSRRAVKQWCPPNVSASCVCFVWLCAAAVCSEIGTLTALCLRQYASRVWLTALVSTVRCRATVKR